MKIMTISDVRKNFASVLDSVIEDAEPVAIPRPGGDTAVVIVDKAEWDSMRDTLHLLGTKANARRLLDSIEQADRGEFVSLDAPAVPAQRRHATDAA